MEGNALRCVLQVFGNYVRTVTIRTIKMGLFLLGTTSLLVAYTELMSCSQKAENVKKRTKIKTPEQPKKVKFET